jgi:hypothetical protein
MRNVTVGSDQKNDRGGSAERNNVHGRGNNSFPDSASMLALTAKYVKNAVQIYFPGLQVGIAIFLRPTAVASPAIPKCSD